tara:strand:+ start:175 stop:480 length:306 start_codon:yes stop_codon:yes gene_type:complete
VKVVEVDMEPYKIMYLNQLKRVDQVVVLVLVIVAAFLVVVETELLDQIHHLHLHQIKDILVVLDMVLIQITLDLVEVVEVPVLLERMDTKVKLHMVVDMVV